MRPDRLSSDLTPPREYLTPMRATRSLVPCTAVLLLLATAGADEKKPAKPTVGKPAPAFSAPAANIETVLPDKKDAKELSLKDFKGKKHVVLFFFPKAMTPG